MNLSLLAALLLVNAVLAGTIVVQFAMPGPDVTTELQAAPRVEAVRPAPVVPPPRTVEAWATTALTRPLFHPDRRPSVVVMATPPPSRALPRLTGLIFGPFGRKAIFAGPSGGSKVVAEGETLDSWTVKAIKPGAVTVAGPEGERAITMAFGARAPIAAQAPVDEHESGLLLRRPLTDPIWPPPPARPQP